MSDQCVRNVAEPLVNNLELSRLLRDRHVTHELSGLIEIARRYQVSDGRLRGADICHPPSGTAVELGDRVGLERELVFVSEPVSQQMVIPISHPLGVKTDQEQVVSLDLLKHRRRVIGFEEEVARLGAELIEH